MSGHFLKKRPMSGHFLKKRPMSGPSQYTSTSPKVEPEPDATKESADVTDV